jgi:hypothetical protein
MFCFDADERVTSNLRRFTQGLQRGNWDGIRVRLFDAYIPRRINCFFGTCFPALANFARETEELDGDRVFFATQGVGGLGHIIAWAFVVGFANCP